MIERDPKVVVGHLRDEVWCGDDMDRLRDQRGVRRVDVGHLVVEQRTPMRVLWLLGLAEQQAHAAELEERHLGRRGEEMSQAECVAVERRGALDVLHVEGDLPELLDVERHCGLLRCGNMS